jgi:uncharacterized protein (DUF2267 family)
MDYDEFVAAVAQAIGDDRCAAEQATGATLQTLGERLGKDEAVNLVPQLGPQLGALVFSVTPPQPYGVEEFLRRVADREQVDPATAEKHASAVLMVLAQILSDEEYDHMRGRLSKDHTPLLPKGAYAGVPSPKEFLARVAERADVDASAAGRVTDAVLETLAERIAPGAAQDLIGRLPVTLHGAIKRGLTDNPGQATRMPVDDFLRSVAERAGVTPEQARADAAAVLTALRETVGTEEFLDITVQLPDEYWAFVSHR